MVDGEGPKNNLRGWPLGTALGKMGVEGQIPYA